MNNAKKAAVDIAKAVAGVFKKYSRNTREAAWAGLNSKEGQKEIDKLILNPDRPVNTIQRLSFREWLERN